MIPFVIIAAPTASGKSTSMAGCLPATSTRQPPYPVEDPVESMVDEITGDAHP
jgi:type II secretory ATPase GspE/PulE/Tfp pilus assembly ATPase PilB-like protein